MRTILAIMFATAALMMGTRAFAQGDTDCLTTLSHAESEFASGRFFGIPGLLEECLKGNRFSNEEKVRVYMLLAQVYLLTDNPSTAEEAYLNLLRANPEFIPGDSDPIDVVYLSKKFTSRPVFTPHFKIGGNMSSQGTIYSQNVISSPDTARVSRRALPGWQIGGGLEWNINDNFGIGAEGFLSQKRFRTDVDRLFRHDDGVNEESQLWIDVPLYVRYGWNVNGKIRPFVYAGGSINLLLMAKSQDSYNDHTENSDENSADQVTPFSAPPRNITYKRNFFNRSLVFGGGTKIKIGKDFIVVDVRYMPGLTNVTNMKYNNYASKDRTELDPWTTQFATIGDVFRVNNFSLSVGYVRPLYNPRRVAHANTKSVSRKLKRDNDEK
jgi:hypothetical protein